MKREIFWEAHPDSTSFPSGGRKIYHERSAIGDMLSAVQNIAMRGLGSEESSLYSYMGGKMLSVSDLIDINYIPSESDISLELLVDFYEDYLCKRIFIFTLRDGQVVKLFFRDATELFHVSGIDHVYEGVPMDGARFIQEIKAGNIDLGMVKNVNAAAYRDYEIRVRSMACIDTIIKNCEYLWYPSGKIPDSEIEVKYLLLKGLDEKNLHLGIDTYKANRPYFARTLLITEGDNAGKFIGRSDERLKVSKLEIRDKDTNRLLISVERELAEQIALIEVKKYADEWVFKELPILIRNHFVDLVGNKVLNVLMQYISLDWMQTISAMDETILSGCIRASDKKAWSLACRKYIEQNKSDIKDKVEKLDSYWVGKIVGEAIRKYDKEDMDSDLVRDITEYIALELENVVAELLTEKLSEQKEVFLEKISTLFA